MASHPIYDHLIPQLTKFNKGVQDNATRRQLVDELYKVFDKDEILKARLKRKLQTGEIYKFISDLVSEDPLIVVIIDEKTEELGEVVEEIRGNVQVVEFRTFRREGISEDVNVFVFEPLGAAPISPPKPRRGPGSGPGPEYSQFWEPIRREGLFKGKPVLIRDEGWIGKKVRGILVELILQNHKCLVQVSCQGEDRLERRRNIIGLFPENEYEYILHESPKSARVRFPVLDKGKNDPKHWPEIRKKLTELGADIYNKIEKAGV